MGDKKLELETVEVEKSYVVKEYEPIHMPLDRINLIRAPFLNSLRSGNDWYKLIDNDHYFAIYPKVIEALLLRPKIKVRFAELKDQTILGWCMYEDSLVHYIWVKSELRRQGIGQSLLPKEFDSVSHLTNKALRLWTQHYPHVRFTPFI